jgi:hypothetical protein
MAVSLFEIAVTRTGRCAVVEAAACEMLLNRSIEAGDQALGPLTPGAMADLWAPAYARPGRVQPLQSPEAAPFLPTSQ